MMHVINVHIIVKENVIRLKMGQKKKYKKEADKAKAQVTARKPILSATHARFFAALFPANGTWTTPRSP